MVGGCCLLFFSLQSTYSAVHVHRHHIFCCPHMHIYTCTGFSKSESDARSFLKLQQHKKQKAFYVAYSSLSLPPLIKLMIDNIN